MSATTVSAADRLPVMVTSPTAGAAVEDGIRELRPNLYKSFLYTRFLVGVVGVLLPIMLIGSDLLVFGNAPRGSLSAYYYHPSFLHVWFIGSLWAIGVGLMVYMGTRKSSTAGLISSFAGVAALVVALFPTGDVGADGGWVTKVHFAAAAVVIGGLAALCVGFGIYDRIRTDSDANAERARRFAPVHLVMAGLIVTGIVAALATSFFGFWPAYGVLFGEALAIFAFGVSWTLKGAELWSGAMRVVG